MILKNAVDDELAAQKRTLSWLAAEMGKTLEGLKLSLNNETIKYKDITLLIEILAIPVTHLFEKKYADINTNLETGSTVSEPVAIYAKEVDLLKENIVLLKNTIEDKNQIIELLSKK